MPHDNSEEVPLITNNHGNYGVPPLTLTKQKAHKDCLCTEQHRLWRQHNSKRKAAGISTDEIGCGRVTYRMSL